MISNTLILLFEIDLANGETFKNILQKTACKIETLNI